MNHSTSPLPRTLPCLNIFGNPVQGQGLRCLWWPQLQAHGSAPAAQVLPRPPTNL